MPVRCSTGPDQRRLMVRLTCRDRVFEHASVMQRERKMKKPRVLFVWDDGDVHGADLSSPELGNVGVGGTDFLFGSIPHELSRRGVAHVSVLHANGNNRLSTLVSDIVPPDGVTLNAHLAQVSITFDFVVMRPGAKMVEWVQALPPQVRVIAWAHNHLRAGMLTWLGAERRVVAVVNVGREQLSLTRLSACYAKSTWIDNPVYPEMAQAGATRTCRAVYMGALVPAKGFLALARMWPAIKDLAPQAELDVIGSADLYGAVSASGQRYIDKVHQALGREPQRLGVHFLGRLGVEKSGVLAGALVGLPNPTGFTETSCLSALEMSSAGLALVVPHRWGYCDTVNPRLSGVYATSRQAYVQKVAALLNQPERAKALGESGRQWVSEHFSYDNVCAEWQALFERLTSGQERWKPRPVRPKGRYPHAMLYRLGVLGRAGQPVVDMADKLVGWSLRR